MAAFIYNMMSKSLQRDVSVIFFIQFHLLVFLLNKFQFEHPTKRNSIVMLATGTSTIPGNNWHYVLKGLYSKHLCSTSAYSGITLHKGVAAQKGSGLVIYLAVIYTIWR